MLISIILKINKKQESAEKDSASDKKRSLQEHKLHMTRKVINNFSYISHLSFRIIFEQYQHQIEDYSECDWKLLESDSTYA